MSNINQRIILKAGSFGLIMGILNTLGFTQEFERYIWIIIMIGAALIIATKIKSKIFIHCLLIGLCWGLDTTFIELIFFNTFMKNNLYLNDIFYQFPLINPQILLVLIGIIFGFISGLVLYLKQLVIRKLFL